MRNRFAEVIYKAAVKDERICIVVADISPAGPMARFREEFPERFINVGVAEQSMIGICAGLALRGMRPFAYTIATFALYRPYEFVRDDLCYQNLPVTVVGIGGGVVYSTLGGTHYAQEDVTIASSMPNMTVLAPCDPNESAAITDWIVGRPEGQAGPVYLRFGKAGEPDITQGAEPFRFGKLRYLRRGKDVAVLSYGVVLGMAAKVAEALQARGKSVSLVGCPTVKPLDREGIAELLMTHAQVLVVEENAPAGGLASAVKEIAWDRRATCDLKTFTLKDQFVHCYGSHDELLAKHGLSVPAILAAVG